MKYKLKCVSCSREIDATPTASTCPQCGPFKGTLDVLYPMGKLRGRFPSELSLLKGRTVFETFFLVLPYANPHSLPSLSVGETPLFNSPDLSALTGLGKLWVKDDGRNPSCSLKDRASAVAIAMAREAGASVVAAASTGNAASSLATLAASASMKAVVFVPRETPRPKLTQMLIHGARVLRLDCSYDRAFDLCQEACEVFGWYNRNTAVNPFTGEGKKTVALEIARDLGWAPEVIVCPVGDGCIMGGIHKAFLDLRELGLVTRMPRLYGVQAEGASPVAQAFVAGTDIEPIGEVKTVADSIAVGHPRDGIKALRAVRDSGGGMVAVSDEEILEAQKTLASVSGIFAEPAASASLAGLTRLVDSNTVDSREVTVLLITGHGLKDIETALRNVAAEDELTEPDIQSIEKRIADFRDV